MRASSAVTPPSNGQAKKELYAPRTLYYRIGAELRLACAPPELLRARACVGNTRPRRAEHPLSVLLQDSLLCWAQR